MSFATWAQRYPEAAAALIRELSADAQHTPHADASEARAQQGVRLSIAQAGAYSWRNNVGATPSRCGHCGGKQRPVRYGLANDSETLNKRIKSSDLILAIPRRITPEMVGTVIAQFGAVECKAPGWAYSGTEREVAQAAWLSLISGIGGFSAFSTGSIKL